MNSQEISDRIPERFWKAAIPAMFVLCISVSGAAAAPAGDTNDLEVVVGKTVEITYSRRYCWFPTIHQFPTGELIVTMRMRPDEWNQEGNLTAYCLSKDGGQSWSPRYTMGEGAGADGACSDARPDGSLWQLYMSVAPVPPGPTEQLRMTLTKFSRGGMDVSQVRDVPLQMEHPVHPRATKLIDRGVSDGHLATVPEFWPWGPIIEALNGDLMAPIYYVAERDRSFYRLALIRSKDGGKSWSEYSTIAAVEPGEQPWPGMGPEGPCETGLVRLADKRLYAIFRTGGNAFIGNAWSSDDGKTWPKPVSIPYRGVALEVRRLSNGALACTTGRPGPVAVMFSMDGTGQTWTHITPIYTGQSTHYTDFIEVEPGKLLVVYDNVPYNWDPIPLADLVSRNVIYGTFVTVKKK